MDNKPVHIKTINEFHRLRGLPGPVHPLVSVVRFEDMRSVPDHPTSWVLDFYAIALKRNFHAKLKYGQQVYDFDEGIMTFMAPGQKIGIESDPDQPIEHFGWLLIFHPDFLWNTALAKGIKQYEYFDYAVKEALFLSEQEEAILTAIMQNIATEYVRIIDSFTQNIIVAHLEVLLSYAQRFYQRQFLTRGINSHDMLSRLEAVLQHCFTPENMVGKGLPTVISVADALHVSPNYLSGLLKTLTGKSTQQHIQDKLIDHAKEMLSTTGLSVSEIAYTLGFDYPQSFSKLFKSKTQLTPVEFRQFYN
ncbi:helix-turn-helix transcriptional regulator [Mucilaginibacter sp. Bleaf8]|uniref:helix-turn-helix domain-containing protein n=1 Tax=Mucilaginibacter sp. Bleaf8 TaxID=2834430 RepID=UPI001BD0AF1D|nr:helix-turn-helix transcriptional regulator [Mucilaginibacter sp. Bleaf8]MBS7563719.1 helix-turn-helix transcriptional regulator [Mucilaginibacter sp. Bleaf8]